MVSYWNIITVVKHPVMRGKESHLKKALEKPNEHSVKAGSIRRFSFSIGLRDDGAGICAAKAVGRDGFPHPQRIRQTVSRKENRACPGKLHPTIGWADSHATPGG